jgi:hypothetical protein
VADERVALVRARRVAATPISGASAMSSSAHDDQHAWKAGEMEMGYGLTRAQQCEAEETETGIHGINSCH